MEPNYIFFLRIYNFLFLKKKMWEPLIHHSSQYYAMMIFYKIFAHHESDVIILNASCVVRCICQLDLCPLFRVFRQPENQSDISLNVYYDEVKRIPCNMWAHFQYKLCYGICELFLQRKTNLQTAVTMISVLLERIRRQQLLPAVLWIPVSVKREYELNRWIHGK